MLLKPKALGIELMPTKGENRGILKNNLTHQIGIMLSSYTRAINLQESRTGSLFRARTKIKNGWIDEIQTAGKKEYGIEDGYEVTCMNYIHENPVKGGLAERSIDWAFSSAKEYAGLRNGTLCNLEIGKRLLEQY